MGVKRRSKGGVWEEAEGCKLVGTEYCVKISSTYLVGVFLSHLRIIRLLMFSIYFGKLFLLFPKFLFI